MKDIRLSPFTMQVMNVGVCMLLAYHWNFSTTNYMLLLILCMVWQIHAALLKLWHGISIRIERKPEPETEGPPPDTGLDPDDPYYRSVRDRECMSCGHKWVAPVVFKPNQTTNLSGELSVWCPKCNSRSIYSSAAYVPGEPR